MSGTTHTLFLRSLSLAGIVTAVTLVATPVVHGQEGERALLNQVSAPARGLAPYEVSGMPLTSERALLGKISPYFIAEASRFEPSASDGPAKLIDGAQALMGRPTIETRRRRVSTR